MTGPYPAALGDLRTRVLTATLLCALLGGAVACQPADDSEGPATGTPTRGPASSGPGTGRPDTDQASVPNFVGMGLRSAQDRAQELGFHGLTSHDAPR
ncbi:hypothetical protein [Streptomyces sp. NBC_00090]|uniref:hypothetical protein n=1 Tax=Streptomyces sp. NBC_00090 TaxID=2903619 RepID=UPI0038632BA3